MLLSFKEKSITVLFVHSCENLETSQLFGISSKGNRIDCYTVCPSQKVSVKGCVLLILWLALQLTETLLLWSLSQQLCECQRIQWATPILLRWNIESSSIFISLSALLIFFTFLWSIFLTYEKNSMTPKFKTEIFTNLWLFM